MPTWAWLVLAALAWAVKLLQLYIAMESDHAEDEEDVRRPSDSGK